MLILPSGRIVDLSTDRAKYHALRQQGVYPDSVHRMFYSLVDIIYRRVDESGNVKCCWTEYDYEFSGYTLETVQAASDWTNEDRVALSQWVQQNAQYRRIETARRRLNENQQQLSVKLHSSPQHLYSLLQHRLNNLSLQSATARQWLATIDNNKQSGVREEEIHWSGLRQYLCQKMPDSLISKTQILNHFDNNMRLELCTERVWREDDGLGFDEVAQLMPHQAVYRMALNLDNSCFGILRFVDCKLNYRVGVVKTLRKGHVMALNKYWFALGPDGSAIPNKEETELFFENAADARSAANQHARESRGLCRGVKAHTYFDYLTLAGGHDYREWFVSLPDYQRIYFGPHFYDHNILAHIRTTTRTDHAGRKLLFIEEVQSDWHQSGKRDGYDNSAWGQVANAPFKQEWPVLAAKLMLIHASQNGFSGLAWSTGSVQEMRYGRHLQSIKQYYDKEIPKALNQLGKTLNCTVESTLIETRDPWLNLERTKDKWRVADVDGKFKTKAKYNSRDEAMAVITRHCRAIQLQVPVLLISGTLRQHIAEKGLPLYGHTLE